MNWIYKNYEISGKKKKHYQSSWIKNTKQRWEKDIPDTEKSLSLQEKQKEANLTTLDVSSKPTSNQPPSFLFLPWGWTSDTTFEAHCVSIFTIISWFQKNF